MLLRYFLFFFLFILLLPIKIHAEDQQNTYNKIMQDSTLYIGTEGTYPPFTFHEEKTNMLTGFDIEIAREVAKRLGVRPVFMEAQWDALFTGLDSKRFDMIASQVGIQSNREAKYDFSIPYMTSSAVLLTHKDNNGLTAFEEIQNKKVAQTLTSNYADIASSYGANIISVDGFNQAVMLLATKRVEATINDRFSVLHFLKEKDQAPVQIVATKVAVSKSGFMFRKGSEELVEKVNQALQSMVDDGTYEKISMEWFGEDASK